MSSWGKAAPVLHPLLFAIYPALALWSSNISEISFTGSQVQVVLPLAISLLIAGLAWGLLSLALSNKKKAGLVVTLSLLLFYSFGHVHETISGSGVLYIKQRYLLLIWSLIFLAGGYLSLRTSSNLVIVTRSLNVIAIVLVIIPLTSVGVYNITPKPSLTPFENETGLTSTNNSTDFNTRPDIYYVILDGYGSSRVLDETLNYDNSEFLDYLRSQGFYVADQSRSNYRFTHASLASSLNMKHVNYLGELVEQDRDDLELYFQLIRDAEVMKFLRSRGYKIVHFKKDWMPRGDDATGHVYVGCETYGTLMGLGLQEDFADVLLRTTMLNAFRQYLSVGSGTKQQKILCDFGKFEEVNRIDGPKFVLAHLDSVHPPYVFGRHGEQVRTTSSAQDWKPREQYLDQLIFINRKLVHLVDMLISANDPPPIIILQADHGPGFFGNQYNEEAVRTTTGILNAYLLPDGATDSLYETISPVNTFRLIFSRYFGADSDLLPDQTYYTPFDSGSYNFIDVTDQVK